MPDAGRMRRASGQATVEWVGLVLLVALALAAAVAFVPVGDRTLGDVLAHAILCAVRGDCHADAARGDTELVAAYGRRDAGLVRRWAPNIAYEPGTFTLPIDWRQCRSHRCSDAPDDRHLDVHRSTRGGLPATAFTHVLRRGGATYLQYWFYYPDSTTTWGGAARAWSRLAGRSSYPGFHRDDWEGYQVRIDASGRALARATAHDGYVYCDGAAITIGCAQGWGPATGWTRVSRGSHAGHIPMTTPLIPVVARPTREGIDVHERVTTAPELRLVPLEPIDPRSYRSFDRDGPLPPWTKVVYRDPLSGSTG
jgi:hypothetical protein